MDALEGLGEEEDTDKLQSEIVIKMEDSSNELIEPIILSMDARQPS